MKRLAALLLLPAFLLAGAAGAAPAAPQAVHAEWLNAFLDQVEDSNAGTGRVSIFRNGHEVYARSFGQKELTGVSYNADTKYQIASVTKMVTAILAFKPIEEGRLSLDDRLSTWFPDMPPAQAITIANLLERTSGLGNFAIKDSTVWVVDRVSEPAILDEIRRQGVSFAAGQDTAYSNSAYLLLRMILDKQSGRTYAEMVAEDAAFPYGERHFLVHGGDVLGSHSRVIYNPDDGTAIAYSTNGERIPTNDFLATIVGLAPTVVPAAGRQSP